MILVHVSGGNAPRLSWLASSIANQGAMVIGANHPGTTSGDSDPVRSTQVWERALDIGVILDFLETTPPAGTNVDLSRVAVIGFSLGGHTALSVSGVEVSKMQFIEYCSERPFKIDCLFYNRAAVDFTQIDQELYEASYKDIRNFTIGFAIWL